MNEAGPHRPRIASVPDNVCRPLWSVMIPAYHCASYLRATLQSVLAQDPGSDRMQIEVVDDCSTWDDPEAVVKEIGQDRVGFYRQPENVGVARNFATCLQRARGKLVHLLHGDDHVLPGFYRKLGEAFEARSEVGAAFCRHLFIDQDGKCLSVSDLEQPVSGILENQLVRLAAEQRIMTPSIAVRREVYERLGGFDYRLICSEDWEMWVRIAAHYPVWYEVEPLAAYRMHMNSNTGRHLRTGEDMRYTRLAIDMFESYLPKEIAASTCRRARQTYALAALQTAGAMLEARDWQAMAVQMREALGFSRSSRVLRQALKLLIRAAPKIAGVSGT
ncbi:glycosyltransferase [Methylocaldum sp.]|uniref:glycosyltransferase n=1 Tax=Methylocaldum sp. TaxID=1969727 RepID=UPI002D2734B2|nr:glycosyltransferase [Methylocaldum sp.]HYE35247.1 glycosyltransferase [Methylocaldum sp.]